MWDREQSKISAAFAMLKAWIGKWAVMALVVLVPIDQALCAGIYVVGESF